jgi:enoyl-CoA hydratase/carnithine racemase
MSDRVIVEVSAGVADVRLNRPDKHNGLDRGMFDALIATGRALAGDRSLRAVVLSGEGKSFCAGLDFPSFMSGPQMGKQALEDMLAREGDSPANFAQRAAWIWAELPVPVIAALHGHVYGGGLQIALAADIRYATPDARLSVREIQWGLVPDMTGTQTLRHLLRLDVLKELTYTGRIVEGREAIELGLVTHVSEDPRNAAMMLAQEIATRSPHAIRADKRLLNAAVTATLEDGLRLEEAEQRALLGSRNQLEAVAAGMAKRAPSFVDPD